MVGRRDYIHQLPEKLAFLISRMPRGTRRELEDKTEIGRGTFEQACNEAHPAYSMLGRDHQELLADACGFSIGWPEWRDVARLDKRPEDRIDTADAFKQALLREFAPLSPGQTVASAKTRAPENDSGTSGSATGGPRMVLAAGAQSINVRDVTAELVAGKRRTASSPLGPMAQVDLDDGQPAGAGAYHVLVEVSCHKGLIVGSNRRFSVRRALLSLDCGDARGRREAIAGINGLPVVLSNSYGETQFVWVGTQRLLRWEVAAGGAIIGHLLFDAGVVEELAPGDVLRVTLSAWLKHIDTDEIDQDPAFGIIDPNGALAQLPEDKLAIEQRRLIEHINKLKLESDGNGQVEIASAELQLERKP